MNRFSKIVFPFFIVFLILSAIGYLSSGEKKAKNDPFSQLKFVFNANKTTDTPLAKIFKKNFDNSIGDYAVAIKNLKTNETFYFNEHKSFQTGSLYKLWVMAAVFDQIKKGNLTNGEVLTEDVDTLNEQFHIPEDTAELTEGTVTLSVKDALYQMITISHNYAALLLSKKIKVSLIRKYIIDNQFSESNVGEDLPTSTASDIKDFFEKLYSETLADKEPTDQMLLLLKQQKLNNKLPKYLPDDVIVAHKTGELDSFTHDAGIVYTPKGDYIIVVLSDSDAPGKAEEKIAEFSRDVYEYFISK